LHRPGEQSSEPSSCCRAVHPRRYSRVVEQSKMSWFPFLSLSSEKLGRIADAPLAPDLEFDNSAEAERVRGNHPRPKNQIYFNPQE
jgi:hypothetical protein